MNIIDLLTDKKIRIVKKDYFLFRSEFKKEEIVTKEIEYCLNFNKLFDVINRDFSLIIGIGGRGRTGKTTLSFWIAKYFYLLKDGYYFFPKIINLSKVIQLGNLDEIRKYHKEAFIIPEGIKFYKRLAMTKQNIKLIEILTELQKLNNLYIFNVPQLSMLDKEIRNTFLDIAIVIRKRGIAKVYAKRIEKEGPLENVTYWQYYGKFNFPDLPEDERRLMIEYDNIVKGLELE